MAYTRVERNASESGRSLRFGVTRGLASSLLPFPGLFDRRGNNSTHAIAQGWHILFRHSLGINGVVQVHRHLCRPEHPVSRAVMLERTHQADRHDGDSELL